MEDSRYCPKCDRFNMFCTCEPSKEDFFTKYWLIILMVILAIIAISASYIIPKKIFEAEDAKVWKCEEGHKEFLRECAANKETIRICKRKMHKLYCEERTRKPVDTHKENW